MKKDGKTAEKPEEKKLYIGSLYRFGYDMTVICEKKKDCIRLLMDEYVREWKKWNPGTDCMTEESDKSWDAGKTFYQSAKEDIEIRELNLNKVTWQ